MTSRPPTPPQIPTAPTALGAFLRGVEGRGLVFAWLLAGSREAGAQALAWALERFRDEAGRTAFGDWPRRFWSLLLAAPGLRRPLPDPAWDARFEWLSRIGHGPRAALLLRLVAGLAESDAASVLGIARPTYRMGLQRALPHGADGRADVEAWEALGQAAQDLVRRLPQLQDRGSEAVPEDRRGMGSRRRPAGRGLHVALALVVVVTALGLAATFLPADRLPTGLTRAPDGVLSERLPDTEPPAGRYAAEDALELHPDLALLLDAGRADAAASDPAFHAWLVAEGEALDAEGEAEAEATAPAATGLPERSAADAAAVTAAASADGEAASRSPSDRFAALDSGARRQLAQAAETWDALPHAERGERRERWLAWGELPADERAALRVSALRFAALDPDAQAALRARFDALDASVRHGWLLGPELGADYPRLHPLVAQVPAEARNALLEALRGLDAQARDDLAVLAARTPPQARAELRVELLATPPAQRARWLRTRVSPPLP